MPSDVLHVHCLPVFLRQVNDVQIFLQNPKHGLDSCASKLWAFVVFCKEEREKVVEEAKAKDMTFCEENG